MTYKCTMYVPWFGPLPWYKDLFLKSCAKSPLIHWVVHSDQSQPVVIPTNMTWVSTDTEDLLFRISSVFTGYEIPERPFTHKLTDLKPFWHLIFTDPSVTSTEFRGWADWDTMHNLAELPWHEFARSCVKFTKGGMPGPLVILRADIPPPQTPPDWQRILSRAAPVGWDDYGYVNRLPCQIVQLGLTPEVDVVYLNMPYALHLGRSKISEQLALMWLDKFFPEAIYDN